MYGLPNDGEMRLNGGNSFVQWIHATVDTRSLQTCILPIVSITVPDGSPM